MFITIIVIGDIMISIILRTIFFYFYVTFIYRLMGKREIGQLSLIDLVVSILIAELGAISIENYKDSIFYTIVPISLLTALEILIAYIKLRNRKIGRLFEGKPSILINEGKLIYSNLEKERYSLDDLLRELRQNNINSIEDVRYAILETNGKLSIFPYKLLKNELVPLPLVVEGKIQYITLKMIGKNEMWLNKVLRDNNLVVEDIFYAVYKRKELYIINYSN